MPLTSMSIDEINVDPRGGVAGVPVVIPGSGFGPPTGRVRFDPLGEDVDAVITTWFPNLVVFTVPALVSVDRTVTVQIQNAGASDSVTIPFWYPAVPPVPPRFQWPNVEAGGPQQDIDNPRIASAADFNRMLDRITSPVTVVMVRPYTVGVLLRDPVYQKADGTVGRADASTQTTGVVIGVVTAVNVPIPGQCQIVDIGDVGGYVGLITGDVYILGSVPGVLVRETDTLNPNYPNTTPGSGHVLVEVGVAASATTLRLRLGDFMVM
jgi:hypothetical protein